MADTNSRTGAGPFSAVEFMLALRYLRTKRVHGGVTLISVISFVGIMLAVGALIAVMSVMNGFRHELLSRLLGVQAHIYVYAPEVRSDGLDDLLADINAVPGVNYAGPVVEGQGLLTSGRRASFAQVIGVRPADLSRFALFQRSEDREAVYTQGNFAGSIETFGEGRHGGDQIIIGSQIASQLGVGVGEEIRLISPEGAATPMGTLPRQKTYEVAAVASVGIHDVDAILVLMPIEQAELFFNRDGPDRIEVRIDNPGEPDAVVERIRQLVPQGVVFDWREQNQQFWDALQVERNMMRIVLSIIVLIAAMNIISGLVMLVKNKSRDIAVLRTMGMSQGSVMRIFLIAGAALGVLGTIAGIVLGMLAVIFIGPIQDAFSFVFGVNVFDPSVYRLYRLPARLAFSDVAYASLFAFLASLLATLAPSWRASRIDPVEALRYE